MAASRRASPAAARPSAARSVPRAPGRRRRPSLWRRALLNVPRPARRARVDPLTALQHEVHELRLAVAALRAEVAALREVPAAAAAEPAALTLLLPLARVALAAGVPAGAVLPVDLGPDTAATEIVLPQPVGARLPEGTLTQGTLPEAPLLDPRLARVADALDQLLGDPVDERPVAAAQRESA